MRLRVAGAANDAQVQNDNLHSDFTRNLVVVDRQPRPGLNFESYVLPRRPHRDARLWPAFRRCVLQTTACFLLSFSPLPSVWSLPPLFLFKVLVYRGVRYPTKAPSSIPGTWPRSSMQPHSYHTAAVCLSGVFQVS
jgi:hypothetical protein